MRKSSQLVCQHLENISREALKKYQDIIRAYISRRQGAYALYRDDLISTSDETQRPAGSPQRGRWAFFRPRQTSPTTGGIIGRLFREFAVTLSIAVLISLLFVLLAAAVGVWTYYRRREARGLLTHLRDADGGAEPRRLRGSPNDQHQKQHEHADDNRSPLAPGHLRSPFIGFIANCLRMDGRQIGSTLVQARSKRDPSTPSGRSERRS